MIVPLTKVEDNNGAVQVTGFANHPLGPVQVVITAELLIRETFRVGEIDWTEYI